ncbi:GNAT family N-acetyltransferase [Micromonospora sp. RHAY321]|uniref:GNAT family N-acetyltransferase n=1 Tax=Micromonospora sp. RHAY321 TaxID=2944807 RepID=UPI00207D0497|nr:GNAT family N-acetyltransferase [Micromonospora sp. RHAY321]MCO1595823.1 GNAT family N-acetyltransferase [Micromonospora sp. RHAY321]
MESLDAVLAAHRAYLLGWNIGEAGGPDLVTYRSDVPHPPLNGVLRVTGRTPQDALTEARRRLDGVPRVWWVGPDSDADAADGLVSLGAVEVARLPIMTVAIADTADAPTPAGLHIAETTDLDTFVPAYARVSGIPAEGVAAAIDREKAFAGDGTVIRLAGRLDDGRIVGTAVAWLTDGLLTLYFVGTQPEERRRGIGAAMTRAALDLAAGRGVHTAALTSTPIGEPVYRRLGFRTAGTFRLLAF